MENLKEHEVEILFESLGKTLQNQDKIINHLGLNKYNYDFWKTRMLSDECFEIAQKYKDFIEEQEEEEKKIPIDPMEIFRRATR